MDPAPPLAPDWLLFLASTELFGGLSEAALRQLGEQLDWIEVGVSEVLIRQGDRGDCMYLIVTGRVQVIDAGSDTEPVERVIAELGPGDAIGEIALWMRDPRSATVRTVSRVGALRLSRDRFDRLSATCRESIEPLDRLVRWRLRKNRLSSALRVSKLFGDVPETTLRVLENELELLWIEGGQTLFREGEAGDAVYLVVSGKLKVLAERAGAEPHLLAEVGRGETVGEMAVIDGLPRSATVMAARDSQVARLTKEGFDRLASGREALLYVAARKLAGRLRTRDVSSRMQLSPAISVAVVPGSAGDSIEEFCRRLTAAFSKIGTALLVSAARLDELAGKPGASQITEREAGHGRVMELLDQLEADHRFVIYQTDAGESAWTHRCLRHCDQVLVAVQTEQAALDGLALLRSLPERGGPSVNVALLHRNSKQLPTRTRQRLAQIRTGLGSFDQHYHVRLEGELDLERLARSLSGNAVGLVLGGGAARGLAHAGVIRALAEAGVPIDLVGGTSQGAIMAAACAMAYDYTEMLEVMARGFKYLMKDKTLPIVSFLSGQHLAEFLLSERGTVEVEDLWIPFFCVLANLTRARMEVLRTGSLVKCMLASSRVPGIYPPIVWNGDLLVDGGIINNVPVDVMQAEPACGYIIACNVSPAVDEPGVTDYGLSVSGWQALWERLKPAAKRKQFPSALSVLLRTMEFGGAAYAARNAGIADLYLNLPVSQFKVNDYPRGPEMAEAAYAYATGKIADWLASSTVPNTAAAASR